jgi:hypothetical protein
MGYWGVRLRVSSFDERISYRFDCHSRRTHELARSPSRPRCTFTYSSRLTPGVFLGTRNFVLWHTSHCACRHPLALCFIDLGCRYPQFPQSRSFPYNRSICALLRRGIAIYRRERLVLPSRTRLVDGRLHGLLSMLAKSGDHHFWIHNFRLGMALAPLGSPPIGEADNSS